MSANLGALIAGLALVLLVILAADSRDCSVRYVARSWRGLVIYMIGVALIVLAVTA